MGGCGLWVWQANRQYELNRQLIAALVNNDTKKALLLVNAGADPNTNFASPPPPTLKLLFNQLLHRSTIPVDDSATAFLIACGDTEPAYGDYLYNRYNAPEYVPLIETLLAHGADTNRSDWFNLSALHNAVYCHYPHVAQLLLEHGANRTHKIGRG